jgi:hypothetical protein
LQRSAKPGRVETLVDFVEALAGDLVQCARGPESLVRRHGLIVFPDDFGANALFADQLEAGLEEVDV